MAIVSTPEERTRQLIHEPVDAGIGRSTTHQPDSTDVPRVALFIAHGMGQQLPFQTLDELAQGLIAEAASRGRNATRVHVSNVQIGETRTQRVELNMRNMNGDPLQLHLYEGYWAPITEGQVNIRDVMSFLIRAGINGIWNCLHPFQRWIFGKFQTFRRQTTGWALLLALLVVVSLIVFNTLAVGYGVQRLIGVTTAGPGDLRFEILTTLVGTVSIITIAFAGLLATLWAVRPAHPSGSISWKAVNAAAAAVFWVWVGVTASGGLLAGLAYARPAWFAAVRCPLFAVWWPVTWGVLLVASFGVRRIMVQYPGDVAAYVATHTLDRFADIRARIKDTVLKQLTAIYKAPEQYETVLIVGHSLGSVVSYDALNALMAGDALGATQLEVVKRTRLLLTFGSPLDKTAFIFAAQGRHSTAIRESAAASLQPLVLQYAPYRNVKWINIHAPRDIVSGPLNFYDVPGTVCPPGVINLCDPDALMPLAAHVEYWKNPLLFQTIYSHLAGVGPAKPSRPLPVAAAIV